MMRYIRWLGILLLSMGWVPAVQAQNAVSVGPAEANGVHVSVTPYLWMSGISGATGAGAATGNIDLKFGDILSQLHFAAMTAARVDFGRWHITTDLMYTSLGQDTGPVLPTGGGISIHTKSLIITGALGYRLFDAQSWNLEAFAGLRGWDEMNRAIISGPNIGSKTVDFNHGWVDPIIGLQGAYKVTPKFALVGAFDIGGFSVGSRFTAQVTAVARWQFNRRFSVFAGYRYLYVDYDSDNFLYRVSIHGPLIGTTFRF